MTHWSWWVSGLALALVMVVHWLSTQRLMAVSGRFTSLVNRLRFGPGETPQFTEAELIAAIRAATAEEFGDPPTGDVSNPHELRSVDDAGELGDVGDDVAVAPPAADALIDLTAPDASGGETPLASLGPTHPIVMAPRSSANHVVFLASIAVGGFLAAWQAGRFTLTASLQSLHFAELSGWSWPLWLLGGGVMVGFGTRMAGGCTSGHGLCGVSRWQKGSLIATACFFATGVGASMLFKWL